MTARIFPCFEFLPTVREMAVDNTVQAAQNAAILSRHDRKPLAKHSMREEHRVMAKTAPVLVEDTAADVVKRKLD